jgi:hypothetical protein
MQFWQFLLPGALGFTLKQAVHTAIDRVRSISRVHKALQLEKEPTCESHHQLQ